jgi:hypothetical protein
LPFTIKGFRAVPSTIISYQFHTISSSQLPMYWIRSISCSVCTIVELPWRLRWNHGFPIGFLCLCGWLRALGSMFFNSKSLVDPAKKIISAAILKIFGGNFLKKCAKRIFYKTKKLFKTHFLFHAVIFRS